MVKTTNQVSFFGGEIVERVIGRFEIAFRTCLGCFIHWIFGGEYVNCKSQKKCSTKKIEPQKSNETMRNPMFDYLFVASFVETCSTIKVRWWSLFIEKYIYEKSLTPPSTFHIPPTLPIPTSLILLGSRIVVFYSML